MIKRKPDSLPAHSSAGRALSSAHDTVILVPAFNESKSIASVIQGIRESCDFPIFVIDDSSTDTTIPEAIRAGAAVIPLAAQLGAWGAMQTGLRLVFREGYKIAITMDADGQHDPAFLKDLLNPVTSGYADVAIGACTQRGSRLRKLAWLLMKYTSGLTFDDITSGYRVYNRKAISILIQPGATLLDYQDVGVLTLLQRHGLSIVDVKVSMRSRQDGASRIFSSWLVVAYYMCQTLLLGFTKRPLRSSNATLPREN